MVPKVAGRRGHPLRRPAARPARGEGRARPADPGARDPRDRARRGQRRGDLRCQPADAGPLARPGRPGRGPPDEDHPRRRRPPRLPRAGRRGEERRRRRVGQRATYQQDLWHYTIARMVDACAMHGIYPYYGPFGDIADAVACEDQFRNAFLLGCVGAWSLHPTQIDDRPPGVLAVGRGRRARPPRGRRDGRRDRRGDARREDGGRRLAQAVPGDGRAGRAARGDRPGPEGGVRRDRGTPRERPAAAPLGALPARVQRARARQGGDAALRRPDPRPRGRRRPGREGRPPARRPVRPPGPAASAAAR